LETAKYVYDEIEVVLTGRRALKQNPTSRRTTHATNRATSIVLVEITPVDIEQGSWKKWVKETDLFTIMEEE
jgi:hypothetical protein